MVRFLSLFAPSDDLPMSPSSRTQGYYFLDVISSIPLLKPKSFILFLSFWLSYLHVIISMMTGQRSWRLVRDCPAIGMVQMPSRIGAVEDCIGHLKISLISLWILTISSFLPSRSQPSSLIFLETQNRYC